MALSAMAARNPRKAAGTPAHLLTAAFEKHVHRERRNEDTEGGWGCGRRSCRAPRCSHAADSWVVAGAGKTHGATAATPLPGSARVHGSLC